MRIPIIADPNMPPDMFALATEREVVFVKNGVTIKFRRGMPHYVVERSKP